MKSPFASKPWDRRIRFLVFALCSLTLDGAANAADTFAEFVRSTPPRTPADELRSFHLPPGFEIQLVAAEPDLLKPMNMAFDEKGRLWVTMTIEYPYPVPLDKKGRDVIKILEDTDDDGRADKITTFAEGLNIPIGIHPYQGGCIAWSIPNIWRFQDTDGDGKADRRDLLFGPFDHTRDTHGNQASFRRGFDGWLYATHGYNNDSHVQGADGQRIDLNSGNTYRMRLDGSRLEHYTWGQVNPFGLAFDPLGNLFSSDCHSAPIYQLLAGAYYPSFGKPHDGLGFAPTMMEQQRGSTALDGISYYADDLWPEEYRDSLFIGDVMTSRIYRDRAVEQGATKIARPMPDFVSTEDPWFRPVDTQLGPDGALYIADFYNRIIGHYEVPLNHPGRDRTSGRIWRVVYRGPDGQLKVRPRRDLSHASARELVAALADPNLTFRRLAADQLTDRLGRSAVAAVRETLAGKPTNVFQTAHCLWVLQRLGALDEKIVVAAAKETSRVVRVHAMRILADTARLTPALHQLALDGLRDSDALVQRCAAEALASHPDYDNIQPLLALLRGVPQRDTHLLYVVRKALRDQLLVEEHFKRLAAGQLGGGDAAAIADVALGVRSATAGAFLIAHVERAAPDGETLANILRHAARYAPESSFDTLARLARARFAGNSDLQLSLLKSIQQGLDQRGVRRSPALQEWGADLAQKLIASVDQTALTWFNQPLEGAANRANPWFLQPRVSADGDKTSLFLCSLPPGGESLTGLLRSKTFVIPAQLTFWLAGHDGFPDQAARKKNFVRLRAADSSEIYAVAFPPRNDTAQKITWDLSRQAGRPGVLEVTDGDTGVAYAWLAVGRFDSSLVPLPSLSPNLVGQRQQSAAELAQTLNLVSLEPELAGILTNAWAEPDSRAAAARALLAFHPDERLAALVPWLGDPGLPAHLLEQVSQVLATQRHSESQSVLVEAVRTTPRRLQIKIAQALAGSPSGAENLLQMVAAKKAPATLLQERSVKDKLLASQADHAGSRIQELTKDLSPIKESAQKLLDQRTKAYDPAKARPGPGEQVFTANCRACHQIGGNGNLVGPQLDGIGHRGLERLCEDILDPNRNVDQAFRNTLLVLKDGDVVSGLFRREEGETVVLAESTGKEISISTKRIQERRASETSLMPDNVGEIISPEDFNHLMAYLLLQVSKPGAP